MSISTSTSDYIDDDDIYSVDVYDEPPIPDESPAYNDKTKKRKKRDNRSIVYAHDSLMENMLGHLWSKHRIDKDHPEEANSNGSIVKAMHVISKQRQDKIAQLLVEFIIKYCQPLHILRNQAFRQLLNYIEAGFHIPCEQTVKKMIDKAYDWSRDQLFGMMNTDDAQEKCRYSKIHQPINDVPMKWNSSYLAWVRLRRLRKAIDYLVLMLPSELERCDRLDGEYLKLTNLTENEWRLLDGLILLLKLFYEATNIFSGSSYPSLNLIYPTMRLLIRKFSPSNEQTKDDYAELLFGPIGPSQPTNDENPDELDIEDEFDTQIISEQLRQPLQASQGQMKKQTPVTTEDLCDLVKAASYLSLQEYWETPEEIGLVASFLDPRIKHLKFLSDESMKRTIINRVRTLCDEEKCHQPSVELDKLPTMSTLKPATTNDLIAALYSSEEPNNEILKETEVDCYLREPVEKIGCNPLAWWKDRSGMLHPDMVKQIMFLKRNMQHFPIFKPDEL
ncbi:25024_t:CDS:2 [Dentiscutata erythropus]|uniref:25024_t:CDS:1 n=1 Tax=Dentiscutata erythropus TaxID=1348616 RepID=A0A9N9NJE0_9GLOM|nr:25024_t:CDS:2 [Dentiscutata erythropus]